MAVLEGCSRVSACILEKQLFPPFTLTAAGGGLEEESKEDVEELGGGGLLKGVEVQDTQDVKQTGHTTAGPPERINYSWPSNMSE